MAAGRSTNTMSEVLVNILRELSVAKTLPDSDLQFLVELETQILQKLRAPLDAVAQATGPMQAPTLPPPPPGMDQSAMAPMMPMAPPMDVPVPPPGGDVPPGLRSQPPLPSPDELQRLLSNNQ